MSATYPHEVPTFSAPERAAHERRRDTRYCVHSRLMLRWLERGECREELIRVEDLSRGGARLIVRMPMAEGEVIYVEGWGAGFQTRAEVRRVYLGLDGQPRLGIAFLDAEPPARLLFGAPKSNS